VLKNTFEDDSLGLSFVHNLWIVSDERFIKLILDTHENDTQAFTKLTKIQNMSQEMNRVNKMSHLTPINAILINGKLDMVNVLFDHILKKKTIMIDITSKDSRERNILHWLIYNKNITDEERQQVFKNFIMHIEQSMMYSPHSDSLKPLFNEIDKDGFLPVTLYVSRIKTDSQDKICHLDMFDQISNKTDYSEVSSNKAPSNFTTPLIMCMKSKLPVYFSKFKNACLIFKNQIISIEETSKRSTIEYAFESEMPEFIDPILDALDRVDSFIIGSSPKYWITLFDICTKVVINARNSGVFNEEAHPMVKYIEKLTHLVYTKTRDKINNGAAEFLNDFSYKSEQDDSEVDIPKPKIMKKMPPMIKKKLMADYNAKVEAAKKAKVDAPVVEMNSTKMIFDNAYKAGDIFSYPFLFKNYEQKEVTIADISAALRGRKHKVIFEILLDYYLDNNIKEPESNDTLLDAILDINWLKVSRLFPKIDTREYYLELHQLGIQYRDIESIYLSIYKLTQTYSDLYKSAEGLDKSKFFNCMLGRALKASGKASEMCLEIIYDTMLNSGYKLDFIKNNGSANLMKESFKKLIFECKFDYVLKVQQMCLLSLDKYREDSLAQIKANIEENKKESDHSDSDGQESSDLEECIYLNDINYVSNFEFIRLGNHT